jgi:hypothetical protein
MKDLLRWKIGIQADTTEAKGGNRPALGWPSDKSRTLIPKGSRTALIGMVVPVALTMPHHHTFGHGDSIELLILQATSRTERHGTIPRLGLTLADT